MVIHEATPSPSSLAGKTALITGGSRGIGAGIALQFARKGISGVAVTYATKKGAAEEVLAKCRELGVKKTVAIQADLLDPKIGSNVIPKVLAGLGTDTIDIVVNNAAVVDFTTFLPFEQITLESFDMMFRGNVFGMISITQAALPHFPPKGGRVINISSIAAKRANEDPLMAFGASKAAIDSFTRSLATSYGRKTRATFNTLCVGATMTDAVKLAFEHAGPELREQNLAQITAQDRIGEPEDIAYIAGFLASEEGRWINGASIAANGGNKELLALQG